MMSVQLSEQKNVNILYKMNKNKFSDFILIKCFKEYNVFFINNN